MQARCFRSNYIFSGFGNYRFYFLTILDVKERFYEILSGNFYEWDNWLLCFWKESYGENFCYGKKLLGRNLDAEAIEEWIEDFKDKPYDELNGTWIEKDEIDMDMSLEGC